MINANLLRAFKKKIIVDVWEISKRSPIPFWAEELIDWMSNNELRIRTIDGLAFADPGDFLIKGIRGEVYPCKRDIFLETYEIVATCKAIDELEPGEKIIYPELDANGMEVKK